MSTDVPRGPGLTGWAIRLARAVAIVAALFLLLGFGAGLWSRREAFEAPASVDVPCGAAPNCVSSLGPGADAIAPLRFEGDADQAWKRFTTLVTERASTFVRIDLESLHVTFDSDVFGFRDDLHASLDREASLIHVRSGSRVGHSDLGANRARVEALRAAFDAR